MRIGIIAALPGELKPLVRGWTRMPVARGLGVQMWQTTRSEIELVAACAGMGSTAARRAFAAAEHEGSMDMAVSVGWAGGLVQEAEAGRTYPVAEVVDTQTGERFQSFRPEGGVVVASTARVAGRQEKGRLARSYGAWLVDMEAAAVGRLAAMRDIPFACFKGVSDTFDADLPDLNRFVDPSGKLRLAPFLAHLAVRPGSWTAVARLGRQSAAAARSLALTVNYFLDEQGASA